MTMLSISPTADPELPAREVASAVGRSAVPQQQPHPLSSTAPSATVTDVRAVHADVQTAAATYEPPHARQALREAVAELRKRRPRGPVDDDVDAASTRRVLIRSLEPRRHVRAPLPERRHGNPPV